MIRLGALLLVAAGVLGAPAHAQRAYEKETGSNIPIPKRAQIPEKGSDAEQGRVVMAEFARCTLDREPAKVAKLLGQPLGHAYVAAMQDLVSDECLAAGQITFQPILLRGALFTELWRRRVIAEAKGQTWEPVLPVYDLSTPITDPDPAVQRQAGLLWLGDCIVKRDRAAANDVVVRPTASKAQSEAYSRLIPNLSPCLPQGQQVTFSKPILEGALAEALYRAPAAPKIESGAQ